MSGHEKRASSAGDALFSNSIWFVNCVCSYQNLNPAEITIWWLFIVSADVGEAY